MKTQGMVYTIVFTLLISFFFVFFLGLANSLTSDRIELNARISLQKGMLKAAGIPFSGDQEASEKYNDLVSLKEVKGQTLYIIKTEEPVYGMIFSGSGLWGTITGIIIVDKNVERIKGIEILSHNETPGLGGRIDEPYYKAQFEDEKINSRGGITIGSAGTGDTDPENSTIDAISGASRTSQLFGIIINNSLKELKDMIGGLS